MLVAPFLAASLVMAQDETAPAAAPEAAPPAPSAQTVPAVPAGPDEAGSYSLGLTLGDQMRNAGVADSLSLESLTRGIKDSLDGKALTPADKDHGVQFLQAGREGVATRNRASAHAFLAKNGKQDGVISTPSGLQYKIMTAGNPKAASPGMDDQVTVQYRGGLLDGTEFDSSYSRGQPASLPLNAVIKGWREALMLMKPGAKWRLFIPPELAYDAFSPPPIPPGSLLIYDVELLSVGAPAVTGAKSPGSKGAKSKGPVPAKGGADAPH